MNKNKITLINISSTIILQGLAFISGPVFSNILGTSNFGIAAVYLTWVQIASTVFSLQAAGVIAVARVYFPVKDQEKYQSSVFSLATIAYLLFSVLTITCVVLISKYFDIHLPMVIFGLAQGWGLYCVGAMNTKFTYEFKAGKNFILSVCTSALTIGVSIVLIYLYPPETNYWGRIIGQSSVYTVIGVIILVYILRKGKTVYNKEYWKFTLPLSVPTVFHLLAYIVLNQSDKIMIQNLISNSAAGIYALACTFSMVLNSVYHALNNSWVPFYYELTRQNQIEDMKIHAKNYIELFTIVTIGFIFMSREVFHIYANSFFWDGTDLIPMFSIGYYFVFLYSFPVNYEFYNKKTKTIAVGTISAAACNIGLNYLLINIWSIKGAVIATMTAQMLQFAFHYYIAKRINPGEFPFRLIDFVPGLIAVVIACGVYWITRDMWLIRWGISAAIGISLFYRILKRREIF